MRFSSALGAAWLGLVLVACEVGVVGPLEGTGPADVAHSPGTEADAGGDVDAGRQSDAGGEVDGGGQVDAGLEADAGGEVDAGQGAGDGGPPAAGTDGGDGGPAGSPDGGTSDGGLSADAGTPFDQYCAALVDAYCHLQIACKRLSPGRKAVCVADREHSYCGARRASVNLGYLQWASQTAASCLASVATWSCEASITSICSDAFQPAADLGRPCLVDADCKSGRACVGTGCGRQCVATGGVNQPCSKSGSPCTQSFCDFTADVCRPLKPVGSSCVNSNECDAYGTCDQTLNRCVSLPGVNQPCQRYYPFCGPGTYCDGSNPGTCRAQKSLGQACRYIDECGSSAFCNWAASPSTCQLKRPVGSGCTNSIDCQPGLQCLDRLCSPLSAENQRCSHSGCQDPQNLGCDSITLTCRRLTYADAGEPCTNSTILCRHDLCRGARFGLDGGQGTMGTCVPRQLGSACEGHGECPVGSTCQRDGGCVVATTGSSCNYSSNCPPLHFCRVVCTSQACTGTCVAQAALGQPCVLDSSSTCVAPGWCKPQQPDGGGALCAEPGELGASCVAGQPHQCKSYSECLGGTCARVGLAQEPCIAAQACVAGACAVSGTSRTCGALLTEGQACSLSSSCASAACVRGSCTARCP